MKAISILTFLAMLTALYSCQSDMPQENEAPKPKTEFRVRASVDSDEESRAAFEYGNKDKNKEVFTWLEACTDYDGDYLTLFNLTKFSEFHQAWNAPNLFIDTIIGKQAEFVYDPETADEIAAGDLFFDLMEPGDLILAVVSEAHSGRLEDSAPGYTNLISYESASTLYDQKIVENPTTETALKHVHMMMHLWDVVKVEEKGKLPDLHFKYISAIFRITLHNKTGKSLFTGPSDIVFTTSAEDRSTFVYGYNYFSVVGNETDGFHLEENFKVPPPRHPLNPTPQDSTIWLSHKTTLKINEKSAIKLPLKDGETYEFYAVVTPRVGISQEIEKFTIDVFDGVESAYYNYHNTDRYTITIDNFNTAIEPGKRYWFDLTATKENVEIDVNEYDENDNLIGTKKSLDKKLVFTSQYKEPEE